MALYKLGDKIPQLDPTAWVAESLKAMQKIKAGMTRAQLLRVFTGEGGLSTRTDQVYVYRQCAYFKVRVHFKPVGKNAGVFGSPDDRITRLSEPFLQWSVGD